MSLRLRVTALLFVLALVVAGGAGSASATTPASGGTLNLVAEQPTQTLNPYSNNLSAWTLFETAPVLEGAFQEAPDGSWQPQLVTSVDVTTSPSFTLTYHIDPAAVWSDGQPVTADDFIFTKNTLTDPTNTSFVSNTTGVAGYSRITSMTALDSKTVQVVFSSPVAYWRELFAPVLPEHALAGEDFQTVWTNAIDDPHTGNPIGDGPFLITNSTASRVTLARNTSWWGGHAPYLSWIVFHVITDQQSEVNALLAGQDQAIYPSFSPAISSDLENLRTTPGIATQSSTVPFFEQLNYNVTGTGGPLEDQTWVRQAIADSVDRPAIVNFLFGSLVPTLPVGQSAIFFPNEAGYAADFAAYSYDASQVTSLMNAHGCTLGGDNVWVCSGQRMSFTLTYPSGNATRASEASLIQSEAAAAGIDIEPDAVPLNTFFGNVLPNHDFQLALYAWIQSGDPSDWDTIYECGGAANYPGYCNSAVDDALAATDSETNASQRIADANDADALLAQDVPVLPLYSRPDFLDYSSRVRGLVDNPNLDGPLWNAQDVWLAPTSAPNNTSLPGIFGTAAVGNALNGNRGTWTSATSYAYQWERCDSGGNNCTAIPAGGTGINYTVHATDAGHTLELQVTAANATGSTPATSAPTAVVTGAGPTNSSLPAITGTAAVGDALNGSRGTWAGSPTSYAYQWERCDNAGTSCTAISAGGSGLNYTVHTADQGHTLKLWVTATNTYGTSAPAASAPTAVVPGGAPTNNSVPTITGAASVGSPLTGSRGTWSNATSYAYQWLRCDSSGNNCTAIPAGGNGLNYTPHAADAGHTLELQVTAGNTYGSTPVASAPTAVVPGGAAGPAVSAITAGDSHSCALVTNGTVECWGYNGYGQLGDGTTTDSSIPARVTGITTATAVAAGYLHSCALLAGGTVACWGYNGYGQLGDGTTTDSSSPVTVTGITAAIAVSTGDYHSCALLAGGTVECWGFDYYGALGDGTTTDSSTPVTVTGITTATAVAADGLGTCALLADGTIDCWGYNASGELGDGTTTNSATPVMVRGITTAMSVSTGDSHSCAALAGGTVACWGYNGYGQLGDGTTTDSSTPVTVTGITTATAVAAGGGPESCARVTNGTVECWGNNGDGQLGNGTTTDSSTPVTVTGITTAAGLSTGGYHGCALLAGGTAKCWGYNASGQLGDGTTTNSSTPVRVVGLP